MLRSRMKVGRLRGTRSNRVALALLTIVALAGALRLYGLGIQSLWLDEFYTLSFSSQPSLQGVIEAKTAAYPPGYYLLMHPVLEVLGHSEWALRLPSAIAGILSVPAMYALGRRLYSSREGLVAALLLAVLYFPLYYSQEARAYSLLLLCVLVAACFLTTILGRLWRAEPLSLSAVAGYVLFAAAGCYLHYSGLYLVILQGALALVVALAGALRSSASRVRALGRVSLVYGLVLVAYLPWVATVLSRLTLGDSGISWVPEPGGFFGTAWGYLKLFFDRSDILTLAALALYSLLLVWTARKALRRRDSRALSAPGALLGLWLLVPYSGAYLISVAWHPLLPPGIARYMIISLPAAYLLLARALVLLCPGGPRARTALAVAATVILLAHLIWALDYYTSPQESDVREAVQETVSLEQGVERDGGKAFLAACSPEPGQFDYYFERLGTGRRVQLNVCDFREMQELQSRVREGGYTHVLYLQRVPLGGPEENVARALTEKYIFLDFRQIYGSPQVSLYRVR